MPYIITLFIFLAAYAAGVYFMKYIRNFRLFNLLFICAVFIPYVWQCLIIYSDVGFYDWNFQNALPVANVSPFMFATIPALLIWPKKIREHHFLLISLLSVGMFLSSVFACIYNAVIDYKLHFHFILNYLSHFVISLFGVYLIRTKQVSLTARNCLISSGVMLGVATVMVVLNVIFDTSFFGLSLNGKHNIYNNVLVDNSYLSALLYYLGLCAVFLIGYSFSRTFAKEKLYTKEK